MPKSVSEQDDQHQDSEITAERDSLLDVGCGLPYRELGSLLMRLTKRLGEVDPTEAAVLVAPLCYEKPTWLVVAILAVVQNGRLLAVALVKRWETTATNKTDQKSLQQRLPVTLHQLLADVGENAPSRGSDLATMMPTLSAAQHPRLRELAQSLRTEIGWHQESILLPLLAAGIPNSAFWIWKPLNSTSVTDRSCGPQAQFCPTIAATKLVSDTVHPPATKRDARIGIPGSITDTHAPVSPKRQGSLLLPDVAAEANVTTFTCPGSHVILTVKHKVIVMGMRPRERLSRHKFLANTFAALDMWRLPVDGIATSAASIAVSLHSEVPLVRGDMKEGYEITDSNLYGAVKDLRCHCSVNVVVNMAMVSVSKGSVFAADVVSTLGNNNINITMISHGKKCY
ncbi:aspartokinase [Beauveria brongniartii RCEF 3172]|uniref:Aspartokinase n=1 Tax=Beauveria brongniartii RCEF 3172 TaxID=1081107 RepID=A0A166XE07_9HYPO|nr:aspartokinase [Beauveria brongniartii RCEF 3172]